LTWLRERRPKLYDRLRYVIIEPSRRRQEWQKQLLREFEGKTDWVARPQDLGERKVCGVIFSNELLDAMPAHRLGWDAARHEWFEWGVTMRNGKLVWARIENPQAGSQNAEVQSLKFKVQAGDPASRFTHHVSRSSLLGPHFMIPELPAALLDVLPNGFTTEICPAAADWWREAGLALRRGRLLTIDYGLSAEEFFVPERSEGTLRAYFRHHLHDELLTNVGEQDLTGHVNFTAIQAAGDAAGLKTEQFVTQSQFLTRIVERMSAQQDISVGWPAARTRQFQTLTHPEHLGRPFRVLIQSRG
jgi:SAM-dependent MidA family methyltransferase